MTTPATNSTRRIVLLGAHSTIGRETARRLAEQGHHIALVGRGAERLDAARDDLAIRSTGKIVTCKVDLAACADKSTVLQDIQNQLGPIDTVMVFYGILGDQGQANVDADHVRDIIDVNFTSGAEWITAAIPFLDASPHQDPVLLVTSSVAGDRGRMSNYAYGAAKAGMNVFMQGLAHRMAQSGRIRPVLLKMGFVNTSMTAHLNPSGPLWAEPEKIADKIEELLRKGGPIVYAPWFWRFILLIIRAVPARIFHRTKL